MAGTVIHVLYSYCMQYLTTSDRVAHSLVMYWNLIFIKISARITKSVIGSYRAALATGLPGTVSSAIMDVKISTDESKVVRVPGMIVETDKDKIADSKLEKGKFHRDFFKNTEDYRFGKITQ